MNLLILLLSFLSLAESPYRVQLLTKHQAETAPTDSSDQNSERTIQEKPTISTTSSTLFQIYEGNHPAPLIKSFPGWMCKDEKKVDEKTKSHLQFIGNRRPDSKLYPGMEEDEDNPGLGAVMNAIEFRPAKDGGMEAIFYGEFNGVRVKVNEAQLKELNAGKTVDLNFDAVLDYTLYVVHTNVRMKVALKGSNLDIQKATARMDITYNPPTSFIGVTSAQKFESKPIELPPMTGRRTSDTSKVKDLTILN